MQFTKHTATVLVAATLIIGGCGDDDGPSGNAGTIAVTVTPAALTVEQGSSGTVTIALVRGGGFAGDVALTVTGLPAGVTTTLTPAQLTGNTLAAEVDVDVAESVAPGDYTATIHATAQGVGEKTVTYVLTVTAKPDFSLAMEPTTLTVAQGASGNATVNITRTNFTGDIALTLDAAAPAGITAVFTPASVPGNSAIAAISVDGAVAPGTYPLTIQGVGTPGTKTAELELTVTTPPEFTLGVAPTSVSTTPGGTADATVTITRNGAFAADVALTLDAPPAGITATFNPASVSGTTSIATVAVDATVAPGDYDVTIAGTAAGATDQSTQLTVTVTAAQASIAIALAPTALSVQQGGSGQTIATLTRTNFTGDVTFAATGAPTGVTVGFNPATTTTDASTATLTVAGTTTPGTYPITITASGTGVTDATAVVDLTVTATGPGVNAEWQFCSAADVPLFFAYQDGTGGAWNAVTPTVAGSVTKFSFTLSQPVGGVMFVSGHTNLPAIASSRAEVGTRASVAAGSAAMRRLPIGRGARQYSSVSRSSMVDYYSTEVTHATAAELATLGTDNCATTQSTKTITGVVAGVAAGEVADLSMGGSSEFFIGGVSAPDVTFVNVPSGVVDFAGSRSNATTGVPDKVIVFRNLNIPDGGALPNAIDFNGAFASVPASAGLTINNSGGDDLLVSTDLFTANSTSLTLTSETMPDPATARTWYGLAPAQMVAGDVHGIAVLAFPSGLFGGDFRMMFRYVGAVANETVTLGPVLADPTVTSLGGGGYPRFRVQGAVPAEYRNGVSLTFADDAGTGNDLSIFATGGYLAAAGSAGDFDLSIPDVAALAGFPIASRLTAGANTISTFNVGWTGTGIVTVQPQAGDELRAAGRSTAITVP
jgi:uncharacterized membrane protein